MSLFLSSVSIGNLLTSRINFAIANPDGTSKLSGPSYYWLFAAMMLVTAIGFIFYASRYEEHRHLQGEDSQAEQASTLPSSTR
jgi:POT family proton-dependent oligopeptide transporter